MTGPLFQPFPMLPGRRAQVWRHDPAFRRPRHFHEEPEINLVVRGRATLGIGDRVVSVGAGDRLLFLPGQDHVLLGSSQELELFVVALHPELFARTGAAAKLASCVSKLDGAELLRAATELAALHDVADATTHETRLAEFFEAALTKFPSCHVSSRRALEWLRGDPGLSGAELARRLRTQQSEVSRRFHADLGVAFVEYRARARLIEFVRWVDAGESFTRAARLANFGSYAQCHRVFKRTLGHTPHEYFGGARDLVDAAVTHGAT